MPRNNVVTKAVDDTDGLEETHIGERRANATDADSIKLLILYAQQNERLFRRLSAKLAQVEGMQRELDARMNEHMEAIDTKLDGHIEDAKPLLAAAQEVTTLRNSSIWLRGSWRVGSVAIGLLIGFASLSMLITAFWEKVVIPYILHTPAAK